jgi:hypothetical protein
VSGGVDALKGMLGLGGGGGLLDLVTGGGGGGGLLSKGAGLLKNVGGKMFGLGGAGEAAGGIGEGVGGGAAKAATKGATGLLGKAVSFGSKFLKIAGPVGVGLGAAYSAFEGFDEDKAEALFGDKGFLSKVGSSLSHVVSDFTFGAVSPETVAAGIKKAGEVTTKAYESGKQLAGTATQWASEKLGMVSAKYESGGRGAGTVSTGKGDLGGASYGTHQLSSKAGTLDAFLKSSGYDKQFAGLQPGSDEFNKKWKELAGSDKGFGASQHDYVTKTHFNPVANAAQGMGMDTNNKGIQEALYSLSVQHGVGGAKNIMDRALAGKDVTKMSSTEILDALYKERGKKTEGGELAYFKKSSADVQAGIEKRYDKELADVKKLSETEMAKKGGESGADAVREAEKEKARLDTELAQQQTKELTGALAKNDQQNAGDIMIGGSNSSAGGGQQLQEPPTTIAGNQTVTWMMANNYA